MKRSADDRNLVCRCLCGADRRRASGHDDVDSCPQEIANQGGYRSNVIARMPKLKGNVASKGLSNRPSPLTRQGRSALPRRGYHAPRAADGEGSVQPTPPNRQRQGPNQRQDRLPRRQGDGPSPAGTRYKGHELALPTWTAAQAENWLGRTLSVAVRLAASVTPAGSLGRSGATSKRLGPSMAGDAAGAGVGVVPMAGRHRSPGHRGRVHALGRHTQPLGSRFGVAGD
jgi:hypothetical protein